MKSSIIILINPEGKILFQLRDENPKISHPGQWGLIGGEINKGETPREAIIREIKEEINCEVKNIKFLFKSNLGKNIIYFFKGEIKTKIGEINLHLTEGQEVEYFNPEAVRTLNAVPLIKEIISQGKWK